MKPLTYGTVQHPHPRRDGKEKATGEHESFGESTCTSAAMFFTHYLLLRYETVDSEGAPTEHGLKTSQAKVDNAPTSIKDFSWSLEEDGRPEQEVYEEALKDLSDMEQQVREQQKLIRELTDEHRTQLELLQIVVSTLFSD